MKSIFLALISVFLLSSYSTKAQSDRELKLWYDKPAEFWNEALHLGNGRLGAMVFGDPVNERIQLNEETFWSGGPSRNDNPRSLEALPEVRRLIFEGEFHEAERLVNENMVAEELHGSMFQIVGNLNLNFPGHEDYTNYYRGLDLERAVFTTIYRVDGVTYQREVFASQPDQVIVVRLTASQPGKLTFTAGMDSPLQQSVRAVDAQTLEMTGLSSTHEGVTGQVRFNARTRFINSGGSISRGQDAIEVSNADEVVIFMRIS